ncbi:MAG: hypothetical protein EA402_14345 [Planctomycetota bacterium]|nr:MAG: hypothetical protein EA402_14345 [Planctomycetota bacterium]
MLGLARFPIRQHFGKVDSYPCSKIRGAGLPLAPIAHDAPMTQSQDPQDEPVADNEAAHVSDPKPQPARRDDVESAVLDGPDDGEPVEADVRPSHPLAWVVAIGFALLIAGLAPLIQRSSGIQPFGSSYLPTLPLILMAIFAMIWNPAMNFLRLPILLMRGRNLLLVGAFTYLVAGVAMTGAAGNWSRSLLTADQVQRNRNLNPAMTGVEDNARNFYGFFVKEQQEGNYAGTIPRDDEGRPLVRRSQWSLPSTAAAYDAGDEATQALIMGLRNPSNQPLGSFFTPLPDGADGFASPFDKASGALSNSFPIIIFGILLMMGVVAVTARQWTHNERLQHPLVQVPVALAEGSLLRNRAFQMTLLAMMAFWFYQIAESYSWHPLPAIRTAPLVNMPDFYKLFGMDSAGGWPRTIMTNFWGSISIYPFAIGIAFLLAIDVGFSVWGGFFFGVMVVGWLYNFGLNVNFDSHGRLAGGGATLAMAMVILWLGRLHYWRLIKAAFLMKGNPGDPLGVLGLRVLLIGAAGLIMVLHFHFDAFWPALLAVLLILAFVLVIARVIAESGLACFQAAHTLGAVTLGLGLPLALPLNGMVAMLWMSTVMVEDTRSNLTGYAVQSAAMAERAKQPPRLMFVIATVVVIIAAVVAVFAHLLTTWTSGGGGMAGHTFSMEGVVRQVTNPSRDLFLGLSLEQRSIFAGGILVFGVVALRRFWYGCPLHPIGLVVATSWPIFLVWGSLMIGWIAKVLVLRYGGSHLYKNLKPVAIALILGDVLGFGMQMIIQLSIGGVEPWRMWP